MAKGKLDEHARLHMQSLGMEPSHMQGTRAQAFVSGRDAVALPEEKPAKRAPRKRGKGR